MRTKRLAEGFVDRYYGSDYEVAKTYDCGVLVSIEIMPKSDGKSVFIWNSKYFDVKPQDDDLTVELEMQTFEQKLLEESGEEDMRETINYFLSDPDLLCLCADYGDFTDVEAINDDETLDDFLNNRVFKDDECYTLEPKKADVDGFDKFIKQYKKGLSIERAAVENI